MYGSTVSSQGESLENNMVPVLTGLRVEGNEILGINIFENEAGEKDFRRAILTIKQNNGAQLRHTIWDGIKGGQPDEKAMDRLNGFMLHVGSTLLGGTPEQYKSAIGEPTSFEEFINSFNNNIIAKAKDKRFTMTIIKKENQSNGKWYAQLPMFPNFIELDGTTPSTLFMKKMYIFEAPEVSTVSKGDNSDPVGEAF